MWLDPRKCQSRSDDGRQYDSVLVPSALRLLWYHYEWWRSWSSTTVSIHITYLAQFPYFPPNRALDSLFSTLKTYGASYPVEFWDTVCQEILFPIFAVLKSSQDLSRFSTQEDMSVWLSTTMIQALRDLIDLYTFYFDILERFLDGLLDLLCVCICQGTLPWPIVPDTKCLTFISTRKRHTCSHWHFVFATAPRK